MHLRKALKIATIGSILQGVGILLDALHHLRIGIETAEGLFTPYHILIFVGFTVTTFGLIRIWESHE